MFPSSLSVILNAAKHLIRGKSQGKRIKIVPEGRYFCSKQPELPLGTFKKLVRGSTTP